MSLSNESNLRPRLASVDVQRKSFAVHAGTIVTNSKPQRIAAMVYRRWPVVVLLLLIFQMTGPFLRAEGITFNNTSGVFDAAGFLTVPANSSAISAPSADFAVVAAGYFVASAHSQTVVTNFNLPGPTGTGVVTGPPGGFSSDTTPGGPSFGTTIIPPGSPSFGTTTNPPGGPSLGAITTEGPSGVAVVPEPASLWLVGIGLAILLFWNHGNRVADRRV